MRWQLFLGLVAWLGFAARATTAAMLHFDDALVALDDDAPALQAA
jgi:hypothetical protein